MSHRDQRTPRREARGTHRERLRARAGTLVDLLRRVPTPAAVLALAAFAFLAGLHAATYSHAVEDRTRDVRSELARARQDVRQLEGELAAVRMERDRLQSVHRFSGRYGISTDLASRVRRVALEEGLKPELAFRLVAVESSFRPYAVSAKGAVGYTQIKPSTARWLEPTLADEQLFEPETNLRLGFRYLRQLLDQFDGDRRLALLAYNQGPGRVDAKLTLGRDPANGYARTVLETGQ